MEGSGTESEGSYIWNWDYISPTVTYVEWFQPVHTPYTADFGLYIQDISGATPNNFADIYIYGDVSASTYEAGISYQQMKIKYGFPNRISGTTIEGSLLGLPVGGSPIVLNFQHDFIENVYGQRQGWMYISLDSPYLSATPTPTISPTPDASYCSAVDGSADTSGFGLPVISGGTPVCGGAGGFIIPFSWFQLIGIDLDDLVIPYIEVCFVPTSFGILTIAGNSIDLDIVAYILGALFLLSLVL